MADLRGNIWRTLRSAADGRVRVMLLASALLGVGAAALSSIAPLALKYLVDALDDARSPGSAWGLALLYVAVTGAARLIEQTQGCAFAQGDQRLQSRLASQGLDRLLRLPMAVHLDLQPAGIFQTHAQAMQGMRFILTHAALTFLPTLAKLIVVAAVVVIHLEPALWLIIGAALAGYVLAFAWGVGRLASPSRAALSAQVSASGYFGDCLTNIEAVKAATAEMRASARYSGFARAAERCWRSFHFRRLQMGAAISIVFTLSLAGALLYGTASGAGHQMSGGDLVLLTMYMAQMAQPVEATGYAARDIAHAANYLEKWTSLLATQSEQNTAGGSPAAQTISFAQSGPPSIRFENVSFAYPNGSPAVSCVDFLIPAAGRAAIVGLSGAGKSSLTRLLMRYVEPDSGRILIDGVPIEALELSRLRGSIAAVPQDAVLFNDTLQENLLLSNPDADPEAIAEAIRLARLKTLIARLPEGLDTRVGERGLRLSGGERQRVAIARAQLSAAKILLLDEATSALDVETEYSICSGILEKRDRTVLMITHRLTAAARMENIIVLDGGRLIECGSHRELLAAGGAYARLWSRQNSDLHNDHATARGSGRSPDSVDSEETAACLKRERP